MPAIAAQNLTIGVCHPAYQIAPVLSARLPEATVFQETGADAMAPRMPDLDVLVISGAWRDELLNGADKLRWIQAIGVGYNQFPLAELQRRGIRLTNAVGVNANAVSEHAMALILALSRRLPEARDNQHRRHWRPMISDPWAREDELAGKTLGIVGLGAIGNRLVTRLPRHSACASLAPRATPPRTRGRPTSCCRPTDLGELLDSADYVALCCPLNADTTNLIGAAELQRMKVVRLSWSTCHAARSLPKPS